MTRVLLAIAFCVVAAAAIHNLCWRRYACNIERKILDTRVHQVLNEPTSEWVRTETGRNAIERLEDCIAVDPADYQMIELLALAQRAAGQPEDALRSYQTALALNDRPQTYVAIATLHYELRQPELGYRNLLQAATFSPAYQMVLGETIGQQLGQDIEARARRLRSRAHRGH